MVDNSATEFFTQRGFGQRMGFGERPALLVVDMVGAFTDPNLPLGSDLTAEIEANLLILDAARTAGIPIFWSVCWYHEDLSDAGIWALKQKGVQSLTIGSPGLDPDPRLGRRPSEPTVLKKYASVFFGSDLSSRLAFNRVDTLLLTGATTSGCVRATAVDACQHGYRPIVVAEAVGDRNRQAHDQALFDLDQKYADVVPVSETVAYLAEVGGED